MKLNQKPKGVTWEGRIRYELSCRFKTAYSTHTCWNARCKSVASLLRRRHRDYDEAGSFKWRKAITRARQGIKERHGSTSIYQQWRKKCTRSASGLSLREIRAENRVRDVMLTEEDAFAIK